jgi:hypothetical protein
VTRLAAAVLAICGAGACVGEAPVTLRWSFGADGIGCAEAGIRTVHVFVGPLGDRGSYDQEVRCELGEAGLEMYGVRGEGRILVLKGLASDAVHYWLTTEIDVPGPGADLGHFVLEPYTPP